MPLTAEQILAASKKCQLARALKVHVPEWQCDVYVKMLTIGELQEWELECLRAKGEGVEDFRSKYLAMCLVDENGARVFPNHAQVKEIDSVVGTRLWKAARDHNSLDEQSLEETGKN